jgi:putative FmdB family regulatory protein
MPLYEYKCENCGDVFELLQKFSDEPTSVHEKCGGKVHRLISTSALLFKGSGFYVNDYAKSGSPSAANGGKHDSGSSESKDGASSSKESSAGSSSSEGSKSDSSKSDGSKSEGAKSEGAKSESAKESSKPSATPTTTTSSTSSDKK